MTEREKQAEVDNLIAVLKQEGMPYPKTCGALLRGDMLNSTLADCRRLVTVARRAKASV